MKFQLKNIDDNLMEYAFNLALKSLKLNEIPVGCVIADINGKIIGYGYNSSIKKNDPTSHAEIMAIRMACKKKKSNKLINCSLYVTLEPCKMCEGAIYQAGIKKVYFGSYSQSLDIFYNKRKKFIMRKMVICFTVGLMKKNAMNCLKIFLRN